jgi:hypothetical protein
MRPAPGTHLSRRRRHQRRGRPSETERPHPRGRGIPNRSSCRQARHGRLSTVGKSGCHPPTPDTPHPTPRRSAGDGPVHTGQPHPSALACPATPGSRSFAGVRPRQARLRRRRRRPRCARLLTRTRPPDDQTAPIRVGRTLDYALNRIRHPTIGIHRPVLTIAVMQVSALPSAVDSSVDQRSSAENAGWKRLIVAASSKNA